MADTLNRLQKAACPVGKWQNVVDTRYHHQQTQEIAASDELLRL